MQAKYIIIILFTCLLYLPAQTFAQDSNEKDSVTKKEEAPSKKGKAYKVVSKSGNINNVQIRKKGGASGEVTIVVMRMNKRVEVTNLQIKTENGNFSTEKFTATNFPVQATIEFQAPSATGFGSSLEQFNCKINLQENGIWEIRINLVNV